MSAQSYPVRVEASLDPQLSRWLWVVKWVLAIPHYIVLTFLWMGFVILSIVAFFAILFTGKYPRSVFDFNVGVLRWTWRVQYYTYGALGTDRYPPFSLEEMPDYPAHLEIEYPARLSRGLVLVKWWLLAIPQYIIAGIFAGGGSWLAWRFGSHDLNWGGGGLIGILVLVAAITLAITGRYPEPLFDVVLGLNRWVLRVAAYGGLMTDKYPPFRLDAGGSEPGARIRISPPVEPGQEPPQPPTTTGAAWTPARIVSVVIGSALALISVSVVAGGATLLWFGRSDGYLTTPTTTYSTNGYAIATKTLSLHANGWDWAGSLIGKVRVRVTEANGARPVFVGIARAGAATNYLSGVRYTTIYGISDSSTMARRNPGTVTPVAPQAAGIWAAQASGSGTQTLTWKAQNGDWMIVVMNRNAAPGLTVRADIGATVPGLGWVAGGLLAGGIVLMAGAVLLIVVPIRRASRAYASRAPDEDAAVS